MKLFKRVTGELPESIIKAQAAWEAALATREAQEAAREAAWEAVEAWVAWVAAREDILKLHSAQCGCDWTRDNSNIFDYGLK